MRGGPEMVISLQKVTPGTEFREIRSKSHRAKILCNVTPEEHFQPRARLGVEKAPPRVTLQRIFALCDFALNFSEFCSWCYLL